MSPRLEINTYQKKPIRVQATLLTEENIEAVAKWCGGSLGSEILDPVKGTFETVLYIDTPEGTMFAVPGRDFVIEGIFGEFYPCKEQVFENSYEQVIP